MAKAFSHYRTFSHDNNETSSTIVGESAQANYVSLIGFSRTFWPSPFAEPVNPINGCGVNPYNSNCQRITQSVVKKLLKITLS